MVPTGQPVSLYYSDDFVSLDQEVKDLQAPKPETHFCLLELPKDQLKSLQMGQTFAFRELSGSQVSGGGFTALCTADATFGVEFLENSNTLLLGKVTPGGEDNKENQENTGANGETEHFGRCTVFAQCRGQLFVKPEKPDIGKVRELLRPTALSQVVPTDQKLYDFASLQHEVASSSQELLTLLSEGPFVEVDGYWRLLPERLQREVLDTALTIITAQGWALQAIDGKALLDEVQKTLPDGEVLVPSLAVLKKVLAGVQKLETESEGASATREPNTLVLDAEKVTVSRALQLLAENPQEVRQRFELAPAPVRTAGPKRPRLAAPAQGSALQVDEFLQVFKDLTNSEMTKESLLEMLATKAYVDEFEGTIHAMDATMLPREPTERLKQLFEMQSHWRPERLHSLMAPSLAGQKVEAWLGKHARQVYLEFTPGEEVRMMTKKFS